MNTITERVVPILDRLIEVGDETTIQAAAEAKVRLDGPLRVAVAGRVKAGKSTLLNAIMGEAIAATNATECTRFITWYQQSSQYEAAAVLSDNSRMPVVLRRSVRDASIELGAETEEITRLEVGVPSPRLGRLTLIDTPGLHSISESVSSRSVGFLAPDSGDQGADVLLFLMRYLHSEDAEFLEAFTDPAARHVDPVRSIAVLSRADELAAGRGDGLLHAQRIADDYRRHPHLRQIVSEVLPVSGLMAFFAATMTQRDFDLLAEAARLDGDELDLLLASPRRFAAEIDRLQSSGAARTDLLDRLGLPGVRMSIMAIRSGAVGGATELADLLGELSGIDPLRRLLVERFAGRTAVLKAARALDLASDLSARMGGKQGRAVERMVARARTNAHELRELDAIGQLLGAEWVDVAGTTVEDLLRILGHAGTAVHHRLGIEADVPPQEQLDRTTRLVSVLSVGQEAGQVSRQKQDLLRAARTSLELIHHQLLIRMAVEKVDNRPSAGGA